LVVRRNLFIDKKKTKRKQKENPRKPEEKKTRCRPSDNCAKMNKLEEFFYIVGSGKWEE
jgi:hypothetical protein